MKMLRLAIIAFILFSPVWFIAFDSQEAVASGNITSPSDTPTITSIHANQHLLESNDKLIYFQYYIPYSSIPGVLASQTFSFELVTTDNTVLGTAVPFPYFYNGYNYGDASFYFSANNTSVVWGTQYYIRIVETSFWFTTPQIFNATVLPTTAYSSYNSTAANQSETATNIISMARAMQNYTGATLLEQIGGGTVFSIPQGQDYYSGVIYGLQAMVPSLFLVQIYKLDAAPTGWITTQFDTYAAQFDGTWIGASVNTTGQQFGLTPATVMGFGFIGILVFGFIIVSAIKWKVMEPGLLCAVSIFILGARMGWIPPSIFASLNQLLGIYIAYLWFGARA